MRQREAKPEAILQLEQELGIELTLAPASASDSKTYICDHEGDVIELNLSECKLEEVPNLLAFEKLQILNLSYNKIGHIDGLDKLTNLQSLDLRWNQLTRIEGLDKLTNLQSLDLRWNQLTRIEGLDELTNLQSLDLSGNQLTRIDGLDKLTNLQSLDLGGNQLTRIEGLDELTNLQVLYLSGNQLTRIEGLDQLANLQSLYLSENQLVRIESLDKLTNLQVLYLSENQLVRIEGLDKLTNLQSLYLSENQLVRIESLDKLTNLQSLDLGENQLTRIDGLDKLTNLQSLDLRWNQLVHIEGLDKLINLQSLYLSGNQLVRIESLDKLTNLQSLRLSGNQLTRIESLDKLTNLQSLWLCENQLTHIEGLDKLTNLQVLYLSGNQLTRIEGLDKLTNLQSLDLSGNQLVRIEGLDKLTNLQSLDLRWNQLTRIEGLDELTNLQSLYLIGNQFTRIEGLDQLANLQSLYLSENQLVRIESLDKLTNLQVLYLSENQLVRIEGLGELTSLQSLYLSGNQFVRIEGLDKLTNLQSLFLIGNQLTRIEGLDKLTNLQSLRLSDNQLVCIEGLDKLNLESLDLSGNQLVRIEGLDKLTNLQSLRLSDNQLVCIEGLDKLNLESLDLSGNQLVRIEGLDYLSRLESLDLSNNKLSVIENLPQTRLKELTVGGNNIEYIRSSFSDKDSELLPCRLIFTPYENYLEDIKRWQLRKPLEMLSLPIKVMLLGNHSSGKSTFLDSLCEGKKDTGSTHVLRVVKKNDIEANFYDFGGQDFYHGIYHAFYSAGALYMLFWRQDLDKNSRGKELQKDESTDSEKILNFNRNYWLGQIRYADRQRRIAGRDISDRENILVVQTHADRDSQKNLKGAAFSVQEEFYVALKRENLGTKDQPSLLQERDEVAQRYLHLRLKEEIAHLKKKMSIDVTKSERILYNYILNKKKRKKSHSPTSIEDLRKAMPDYTDTTSSLKGELHQLYLHGEVLYYKDDEELSNLVWLDPEATVNYIHTKILDKRIIGRKGVVEKKVIEKKDEHLVHLLELEKVIYKNRAREEYIIPGYLPLAEGDEMYEWLKLGYLQPNITLKFEHFIPFGLINQLICHYGQGENDLKKFWRDQLFFTLVNMPSEKESVKREREGSLLYAEDRGPETYPKGRYMVWVSLNHEQLTIEVYIKPIDQGVEHLVSQVERMLLQDILDMYWSNLPPSNDESYLSRRRQEHRRLRQDFPIEDLYISTSKLPLCQERRLFVNLASIDHYDPTNGIEEAGGSRGMAVAYPLNKDGELDKGQAQPISLRSFQHLTDNKHIGKMKKLFISYSKDDKAELKVCLQFFKPLEDKGLVTIYYDERTEAGAEIHPTIHKEIAEADVIVVLVSPSLLSTDYITRLELPLAKKLRKRIFPFVLKPCMWVDNEIINAVYVSLKGEEASQKILFDRKSGAYVSEGFKLDVWRKFMEEFKEKVLHINP